MTLGELPLLVRSGRLREVSSFGWEVLPRAWVEGEVGCGVCSVVSCSAASLQLRLPAKKGVSGLPAACKSRRETCEEFKQEGIRQPN